MQLKKEEKLVSDLDIYERSNLFREVVNNKGNIQNIISLSNLSNLLLVLIYVY